MDATKQSREVEMTFADGHSEGLLVTDLGPNLCRLEESSVLDEARYHDIVETEPQVDGTLRFIRVVAASGLKTLWWILSEAQIKSSALSTLLDKVTAVGGHWEKIFGGVLLVHLSPAEYDLIEGELTNLFDRVRQ